MTLIAKKPCSFGGLDFYIGDEIPAELVADATRQEKYGVLIILGDDVKVKAGSYETDDNITLTLAAYEADIDFTKAEIVEAVEILQKTPTAAIESINALDADSNVFKLVRSIETRTNVKKAIAAMLEGENTNDADENNIEDNGEEIKD